jgi:dolichol-phosphate mannosyltransferase
MEMSRHGTGAGGTAPELSVIVPMHNEEGNVGLLAERISRVLDAEGIAYEVLFVDDGSTDGSAAAVEGLARAIPEVRLVRLARNFGKEAAMLAGYDRVRGRAVVVLDADLQQPPELFPEMLALWRRGYDVVHAVRADTEGISPIRRFASTAFYWINGQLAGVQIPSHAADFGLMDRAVVEVLRQCREQHRFNRALVAWAGFRNAAITYTAAPRHAGRTHWGWRRLIGYAMDGILSFSVRPLRLLGLLGGLVSAMSFGYLTLVAILRIGWPELAGAAFGYASIIGMVSLLGGFQLLGIWLLGEYIGRIYEQAKGRPAYIVREDRTWRADPASSPQPVSHPARITDAA